MPRYLTRPALVAVATALALLTATACASPLVDTPAAPAPVSTGPQPGPTSQAAPPGPATKLPLTVKNATFSWTISKVESAPMVTDKKGQTYTSTNDQFCLVTMSVKNLTASKQPYGILFDRVTAATGNEYNSTGAVFDGNVLSTYPDYNANEERPLVVMFSVPADFAIAAILVGAADFDDSAGVKVPLT